VRTTYDPTGHDLIPCGYHIFNGEFAIGKRGAVHVDELFLALVAVIITGGKKWVRRTVPHEGISKSFVYDSEVSLIPEFLKIATSNGPVLFN
jgi:hypothetical protein